MEKNYFMGLSFFKIKTDKELRAATSLGMVKFNTLSVLFSNTYSKIYGASIEESQANLVKDFVFNSSTELLFFVLFSLKKSCVEFPQKVVFYFKDAKSKLSTKRSMCCITLSGDR